MDNGEWQEEEKSGKMGEEEKESTRSILERMQREDAEQTRKRLGAVTKIVNILSEERFPPAEVKQVLQAVALVMGVARAGSLDGDLIGSVAPIQMHRIC